MACRAYLCIRASPKKSVQNSRSSLSIKGERFSPSGKRNSELTEKDIVFPAYNFLNPQVIVNKSKIHTAGNGTFRVEFQVNENIGFFAKKSLGGTIKVNHPDGGIAGKEVEVSQAGPIGTGFKFSFP